MAHFILPGSIEQDGSVIQCAVLEGTHDFDIAGGNVRYVRFDVKDRLPDEKTVLDMAARVYENSTGCLINHNFCMKG